MLFGNRGQHGRCDLGGHTHYGELFTLGNTFLEECFLLLWSCWYRFPIDDSNLFAQFLEQSAIRFTLFWSVGQGIPFQSWLGLPSFQLHSVIEPSSAVDLLALSAWCAGITLKERKAGGMGHTDLPSEFRVVSPLIIKVNGICPGYGEGSGGCDSCDT